jgi:protocatechuate 3,4-dioxygenase beta subunit
MAEGKTDLDGALRELEAVLAEEVGRLGANYRAVFVCCCLEGMSRVEAARHLGWKEGTVAGRLAEARKRLQARLRRRGVTLGAALCAGAVTGAAGAVPPVPLARNTVRAAVEVAAGQALTGVSAQVVALVEGMTRTMVMKKLMLAAALSLAVGVLVVGLGICLHGEPAAVAAENRQAARAPEQPEPPKAKASAPAVAEGEVLIRGRVVTPDGLPAAGAELFFLPVPPGARAGEPRPTARTDDDGRFAFSARRDNLRSGRQIVAVANGFGVAWAAADTLGKGDIALRLARDQLVEGRILDLEGRPVSGGVVSPQEVLAAETDDLTEVLKKWAPDGNRVSPLLTRELFSPRGTGILAPATTDAAGRFRFRGAGHERVLVLRVEGPTIESKTLYVLGRPGVDPRDLPKAHPGVPAMRRGNSPVVYGPKFDHLAGPTRPIAGVVRDQATGKPLAEVGINAHADGSWWQDYVSTQTDAEGRYRLAGLPVAASYNVSAYAPNETDYLPGGQKVAGGEGVAPLTQDFQLIQGVRVTGRVTDKATGKPVHTALWYSPLADNAFFKKLPNSEWYRSSSQGIVTDRDGKFSLRALPGSGLIRFRAEVDGDRYMQAELDPADRKRAYSVGRSGLGQSFLTAGNAIETLSGHHAYRIIEPAEKARTYTCDVELDCGVDRSGTLLDPEGKPLEGARAGGLNPLGGPVTMEGSSFTVRALHASAPREIAFLHTGRKLAGHLVVTGASKEPLRVRLEPWGGLTGRVLDEDGKPVAGATVSVHYSDNNVRWLSEAVLKDLHADNEGRFLVEGLIPSREFAVGFRKGRNFLDGGEGLRKLTVSAGKTNVLGDVRTKVFRVP